MLIPKRAQFEMPVVIILPRDKLQMMKTSLLGSSKVLGMMMRTQPARMMAGMILLSNAFCNLLFLVLGHLFGPFNILLTWNATFVVYFRVFYFSLNVFLD